MQLKFCPQITSGNVGPSGIEAIDKWVMSTMTSTVLRAFGLIARVTKPPFYER
jgi:hypothetical protein